MTTALTPRQEEIRRLLLQLLTQAEIAERLEISVRTVEHHCAEIRRKLDSGTTRAAVGRRRRKRGARSRD